MKNTITVALIAILLTSNNVYALENAFPLFKQQISQSLQKRNSNVNVDQLVYSAPENLYQNLNSPRPDCTGSAHSILCSHRKEFNEISAQILGTVSQVSTVGNTNPVDPDTYVIIVPGIFGEFIEQPAFGDIFSKDSIAKREWATRYTLNRTIKDNQVLLSRLDSKNPTGEKEIPLKDLFRVASIDQNGQATVRVAIFNTPAMSLETLGDVTDRARIFNRRLEKLFTVIGHIPKNIIFIGYSRGTTFGLEMLAQAKARNLLYLNNVRAMVGLGGVVFGSTLADNAILNIGSVPNKQIRYLKDYVNALQTYPDDANLAERIALNVQNDHVRHVLELNLAALFLKTNKFDITKLSLESLIPKTDPMSSFATVLLLAKNYGFFDFNPNIMLAQKRSNNIRRFKIFVDAVLTGVTQLTTRDRLQWWRTRSIPTNVKYFSVSGLIDSAESQFVKQSLGFNLESPDDTSLFQNWSDFGSVKFTDPQSNLSYEGTPMNDSQVDIVSSQFWTDVIASLNPANAGVRGIQLGILATHHWGLALPYVNTFKKNNQIVVNGTPREALLEAIVNSVLNYN